ncbi:thioredoxin family protein [Candidatus Roizmanbacteria bacterium]|nr:thioredoxin family protein [Candidatus Roizmanbacteria bacterium]
MVKQLVIIIIVILGIIGGGLYIANQEPQNTSQADQEKAEMVEKSNTSRYIEYSKPALDQATSNRRVLYFYANWCPTCRPADANFKANGDRIPEDLTVLRVNYSDSETDQEEKDLAKKYGVTYQHTFVQIDGEGNEVTKWNGGQINELLANIK